MSTSVGVRGAHVTLGHGKVRETVGIPGTGISYTETQSSRAADARGLPAPASAGSLVVLLLALGVVFVLAYACGTLIR